MKCFVADVAVLPHWLSVSQSRSILSKEHPRFNREKAGALSCSDQIAGGHEGKGNVQRDAGTAAFVSSDGDRCKALDLG